MQTHYLLRASV